jgi:hypothetical protein
MDTRNAIQVDVQLDPDSWHGTNTEGIWTRLVKPLADRAIVEVDNIPFFAKSLSLGDKICIRFHHCRVTIDGVVERGGHSTYRVFFEKQSIAVSKMLDIIKAMGCDWERTKFRGGELYALDIPPEVDIYNVYQILEAGQREGSWLFEEGYVGDPLRDDPTS